MNISEHTLLALQFVDWLVPIVRDLVIVWFVLGLGRRLARLEARDADRLARRDP